MKQNLKTELTTLTKSVSQQPTSNRFGFGRPHDLCPVPHESFAGLQMAVVTPDPDGGEPKISSTAYVPRPSLCLPTDPATLASFSRGDTIVHPRKSEV